MDCFEQELAYFRANGGFPDAHPYRCFGFDVPGVTLYRVSCYAYVL